MTLCAGPTEDGAWPSAGAARMPSIPVSARDSDAIFTSAPLIAGLGDGIPMAPKRLCLWKVIRPEPKRLGRTVIRGMSFRIYRLAKNQANKCARERGLVQIITTERRRKTRPNAGVAISRLPGRSFLNLRDSHGRNGRPVGTRLP